MLDVVGTQPELSSVYRLTTLPVRFHEAYATVDREENRTSYADVPGLPRKAMWIFDFANLEKWRAWKAKEKSLTLVPVSLLVEHTTQTEIKRRLLSAGPMPFTMVHGFCHLLCSILRLESWLNPIWKVRAVAT